MRSSFTADALAELNSLPSDWPEIEYISGAGYVGDWSTLLFGRKIPYSPKLLSELTFFQNQRMDINMLPS